MSVVEDVADGVANPWPAIPSSGRVVVVGGGLAAARVCSALRRKGLTGPIDVLAAEERLPYDRPPLSKDVLAGARDETPLPFDPGKLDVTFHAGRAATGLDIRARRVRTTSGDQRYDGLVIATGGVPIRFPGEGDQITLRNLEDAHRLRERLVPRARVVVVGASWIGAEVTTAALAAGASVTCLELDDLPLGRTLGTAVASHLLPWWRDVDLRCGTAVREVAPDGVVLADGTLVPADVVVTGVGIRPATDWLDGSGLPVDRGVLTDDRCRTSAPGVVAVGDVARRWSPRNSSHLLVEHWDDAGAAATAAAAALLTEDAPPFDPVPYFWSDQFGHKVQYVGHHSPADRPQVVTDGDDLRSVWWTTPDGERSAWLGVDLPREVVKARSSIGTRVAEPATP